MKANQDDSIPFDNLYFPAQLNVLCDNSAKWRPQSLTGGSPFFTHADSLGSNMISAGGIVTGILRYYLLRAKYISILSDRFYVSLENFSAIDWSAHCRAVKTIASKSLKKIVW